jgi:type VII secretion-associated serine protease mycosin
MLAFGTPAQADAVRRGEWHLAALKVTAAHRITTGKGVVVGVIDTGVQSHPDLRRNLLNGTNALAGNRGSGKVDEDGHGTEMAGLIAAHGNGRNGVLGIAPSAKILPVRDANKNNNGSGISTAAGIEWAIRNGASVINVSSSSGPSLELGEAIKSAAAYDAVVIAGSGNRPRFLQFGYPAAIPGVLAVGSTDRSNKHADFSISGEQIQLCAPGVDIVSTKLNGKYSISRGTSSSTAIVSGAAALVRAKFPDLTARQVIHRLTATATDIGPPGRDKDCGFGLLNIVGALTADVPDDPGVSPDASVPPTPDPTPTTTGPDNNAAPPNEPTSANVPAIVGGISGVLLAGGLVAFLLVRRRRRP